MVEERDFASVPERPAIGLTVTSKVARDACSAAKRTSIGPETEARAFVAPDENVSDCENEYEVIYQIQIVRNHPLYSTLRTRYSIRGPRPDLGHLSAE
jgi:hypothetical protein